MQKIFLAYTFLFLSNLLFATQADSIAFYLNNYQPEKAISLINKEILDNPDQADLHYLKARAHKSLFEVTEAVSSVERALELDSLSVNSWFLAADLYNMSGDFAKSIFSYQKILSNDSTNMQAHFKLANMQFRVEKFLKASLHYLEVVENDSTNWYALRRLARTYEKLGLPVELTIPTYYSVLELNPADRVSKRRIANIFLANKMYREAVDATNEFLETDSLDTKILSYNGYGCIQLHEQDSAIASFTKCLNLNDSTFFNYKYLGLAYFNKRNYIEAIDNLEKAHKISNIDPYINYYLGASWGRSLDKQKGIDYLKETVELLRPDENFLSKTYTELGKAYAGLERYSDADEAYNIAYEYNERNTDLYFIMGMHYYEKDNYLAEKYLTMYIDSTLAHDENSAKEKYYREMSERYLNKIEEDEFWNKEEKQTK